MLLMIQYNPENRQTILQWHQRLQFFFSPLLSIFNCEVISVYGFFWYFHKKDCTNLLRGPSLQSSDCIHKQELMLHGRFIAVQKNSPNLHALLFAEFWVQEKRGSVVTYTCSSYYVKYFSTQLYKESQPCLHCFHGHLHRLDFPLLSYTIFWSKSSHLLRDKP